VVKKLNRTTTLFAALFFLGVAAFTSNARAEDKSKHDVKELAKQSQNPVSKLISVPFEMNNTLNNGPEDAYAMTLNIKPVIPMHLSENWNLINRAIVPVIYQDERFQGEGDIFGLGDFTYQGFITPARPGKFIWGVGPQLGLPTGMDRLTSNQWTLGPSILGLVMPGHWVIGALVANSWNIGNGYDDAPKVNLFSAQYFINYNMEGGWYLTTAPTITANWEAEDSDNKWTVPFGGGVGKVFKIGKQNVNMKVAAYYNVEKPDNASDVNIQFTCTFLFPK
jgi:hypothetical protein